MKRSVAWGIGVGCVALGLVFVLRNQEQTASVAIAAPAAKEAAPAPAAATPDAPAAPEKIVYTFPDQPKMQEFGQLWQQRQGMLIRMSVLQAYWKEEESRLTDLNKKLTDTYQIDPTKSYSLNTDRRVLIEQETPPAPAQVATPAPAAPAAR